MKENYIISKTDLIINPNGSIYHLGLKPEQLASKIITVGDPDRVEVIAQYLESREFTLSKREFVSTTGLFEGKRITIISSGMGTDNVEILMTELDALVNIDFNDRSIKPVHTTLDIVRLGTSGSVQNEIALDAELCSEFAFGLDTLMQFYALPVSEVDSLAIRTLKDQLSLNYTPYFAPSSPALLARIGYDMLKGITVTCPGFYSPQGRQVRLVPAINNIINKLSAFRIGNDEMITNLEMETAGYYALGKLLGHHLLSVNAIVAHRLTNKFSTNADMVIDQLAQKIMKRI